MKTELRAAIRPCPTCRLELVAARVAEADPELSAKRIREALGAAVTNRAVLRDLVTDRVLPAFQPLLSVWVAIFYALGGDQAMAAPITYFGALFLWALASFTAGFP